MTYTVERQILQTADYLRMYPKRCWIPWARSRVRIAAKIGHRVGIWGGAKTEHPIASQDQVRIADVKTASDAGAKHARP
jgi:hypothetical protein